MKIKNREALRMERLGSSLCRGIYPFSFCIPNEDYPVPLLKRKMGGRWTEYDGWQLYISPDHRGELDVLVCLGLYTTYTIKYRHTVKRGWVCRSSCWVWICVHPNVWPLRRDRWVWIRRWCPPRWCRRRWTSRTEAQVRTATAGSDPNLSIIQFLDYNHLSKK